MKRVIMLLAVSLGVAAVAAIAAAQEEKTLNQQFEELLPGMGAEKIPDRNGPQQQWQRICFEAGAPGNEAKREEACKAMIEKLGPETAKPGRIWLLKQLEYIGRGECVEAVAAVLDDKDVQVRDAARRALANNSDAAANVKLLAKLPGAKGTWRVGLVNALGFRGDPASVGALVGLLRDRDQAAVAAAANALGKIGGAQAAGALKAALGNAPDKLKAPLADAYLLCADKMLEEGKVKEAAAIYNELANERSPRAIRLAAMRGKLEAAGKKAP